MPLRRIVPGCGPTALRSVRTSAARGTRRRPPLPACGARPRLSVVRPRLRTTGGGSQCPPEPGGRKPAGREEQQDAETRDDRSDLDAPALAAEPGAELTVDGVEIRRRCVREAAAGRLGDTSEGLRIGRDGDKLLQPARQRHFDGGVACPERDRARPAPSAPPRASPRRVGRTPPSCPRPADKAGSRPAWRAAWPDRNPSPAARLPRARAPTRRRSPYRRPAATARAPPGPRRGRRRRHDLGLRRE